MSAEAKAIRSALTRPGDRAAPLFDPASLVGLPDPARRWLRRSIPADAPLCPVAELTMEGEIALKGRWMPFRARQTLRAGVGFVWEAAVGRRLMRFYGADALGPDGGSLAFRLWGLLPVARESGPDVELSGWGRLAAETVAWLPKALTPQSGAVWRAIDDRHAAVTPAGRGPDIEVRVEVDRAGVLRELRLDRWDASSDPPRTRPFGGTTSSEVLSPDGVRLSGAGEVGWDWATPEAERGRFFRYRITGVLPSPS